MSQTSRYARVLNAENIEPNSTYRHILELAGQANTVLDVGCHTGYLGRLFLDGGADVWGVDNDEEALRAAEQAGIVTRLADLDLKALTDVVPDARFDAIIFADVLEHLKRPDVVLADSARLLSPTGLVLASIPNVAHGNVRLDLLLGRFAYTEIGLLDHTHLRFFTAETLEELFVDAGFRIDAVRRVHSPVDGRRIEAAAEALGLRGRTEEFLALLSTEAAETFQYVVAARPVQRPTRSTGSVWTAGDRNLPAEGPSAYLAIDEVPNVVADMRAVIAGLEASLRETRAHLEQVVHDKDEVIGGLEASLAETRSYFETAIAGKDDVIAGLEASLAETRSYLESVIADRDRTISDLESDLGDTGRQLTEALSNLAVLERRYQMVHAPTVTVVVVNWNGRHLVADCLHSLREQTYPSHRFQVLVVDNGSTDGSAELIRRQFPEVSLIEAGENLGFAAGNNLAIDRTESDYVALLNNDAVAEPDWLAELVAVAESNPAIGAVNAKVWLTHDRVTLTARVSSTFVPGDHDPRRLAAQVAAQAEVGTAAVPVEFTRGAFGVETGPHGLYRWITEDAELRVPVVDPAAGSVIVTLLPVEPPSHAPDAAICFSIEGRVVGEWKVPRGGPLRVTIPFHRGDCRPVVQNAGSVVLPDGSGQDRGTLLVGGEAFYEVDRGQFDNIEEVPAFCGAASLLRREALKEVGALDATFFMYYEDTDLSLRLRRAGWRILLAPRAVVRHAHSATSIEWSPRFCYFTERNRLLMLIKNADGALIAREWLRYSRRLFQKEESRENRIRYLMVQRSLLRRLPMLIAERRRLRCRQDRAPLRLRSVPQPDAGQGERLP